MSDPNAVGANPTPEPPPDVPVPEAAAPDSAPVPEPPAVGPQPPTSSLDLDPGTPVEAPAQRPDGSGLDLPGSSASPYGTPEPAGRSSTYGTPPAAAPYAAPAAPSYAASGSAPAGAGYGGPAGGVPPQAAQGTYTYAQAPMSDPDQRTWAMVSHLGGALLSWMVPLVVYLTCKDRGAYVADQSREALNFQITLFIAYVVSAVLMFAIIGFVLFPIVWIFAIVCGIMASVATNKGDPYRYPLCIRFLS